MLNFIKYIAYAIIIALVGYAAFGTDSYDSRAGYLVYSALLVPLSYYLIRGLYDAHELTGTRRLVISGVIQAGTAKFLIQSAMMLSVVYWVGAAMAIGLAYVTYRLQANCVRRSHAMQMPLMAQNKSPDTNYQYPASTPRYTYADVVGMDSLKTRLMEAAQEVVGEGLKAKSFSSKKRRQLARKGQLNRPVDPNVRNGILLFSEPGNGKTFIAEALAGELGLPFVQATFGDMVSMWIGETTQKAMRVFDDAIAQAPCLLFLDEIDSIIADRSKIAFSESESPKTTNAILTRLVDIRDKGVVIVAATNFIDKIDSAAKREGRFDYKIEVPAPDMPARVHLLRSTLQSGLPAGVVAVDSAIESAAKRWEGFSVARIKAIGLETVSYAQKSSGLHTITFEHLMESLRRIQGTRGDRLSEDLPTLDELSMPADMAKTLKGIANRMKNIAQTEELGGSVPSGLLFYGPPGTGKTFTAQSLAKTTGWAFIATSGQDLLSRPERIDEIIAQAKDIRPCIVMIDEADDVFADRSTSPFTKTVTNKLLQVMDGAGGKASDILWIAATNLPDSMDAAALRGGRFTEKVYFDLPDEKTVASFVKKWISTSKAKFDSSLTAEVIAEEIGNVSLGNVKEIMQNAVNEMISRRTGDHDSYVTHEDIRGAMRVVFGV